MMTLEKFGRSQRACKKVTNSTKLGVYSDYLSEQRRKGLFKAGKYAAYRAYKIRGAYYKISTLSDEERGRD